MQIHHRITTRFQQLKMPKIQSHALALLVAILLAYVSLFTVSASAQSSQQERALMDYAKKYDQEQREKRADDMERKLSGRPSKGQFADAFANLLWIFGLVIVGAIGWTMFSLRSGSSSLQSPGGKGFTETPEEIDEKIAAQNRMLGLSEQAVAKMSVDEICEKIAVSEKGAKRLLMTLGWNALDFSGKEAQAVKHARRKQASELAGKDGDFSKMTEKEVLAKLEESAETNRLMAIAIEGEKTNPPGTRNIVIALETTGVALGFHTYIGLFDENFQSIPNAQGFYSNNESSTHSSGTTNIPDEDIDLPLGANRSTSRFWLALQKNSIPQSCKHITIFVSPINLYWDPDDGDKSVPKFLKNIDVKVWTDGFSSDLIEFQTAFKRNTTKYMQIGCLHLNESKLWEFEQVKDTYAEVHNNKIGDSIEEIVQNFPWVSTKI